MPQRSWVTCAVLPTGEATGGMGQWHSGIEQSYWRKGACQGANPPFSGVELSLPS